MALPQAEAIRERAARGLLLFNGGAVVGLDGDEWVVSTPGGRYRVDLADETCTCPDHEHRAGPLGIACKHVYACAIAHAARRGGTREVRTPAVAAGDSFKASGGRGLRELRDRYEHELMDDEERQELRDLLRARRTSRR